MLQIGSNGREFRQRIQCVDPRALQLGEQLAPLFYSAGQRRAVAVVAIHRTLLLECFDRTRQKIALPRARYGVCDIAHGFEPLPQAGGHCLAHAFGDALLQ